jgi:hypothetical protein
VAKALTYNPQLSFLMKLQKDSYEWALRHLKEEGDSDLFPTPFEIETIEHCWPKVLAYLQQLEVEKHSWNPGRRFVIPKEPLAFRTATQLYPFDSIILAALVYEFGGAIDSHRLPAGYKQVF